MTRNHAHPSTTLWRNAFGRGARPEAESLSTRGKGVGHSRGEENRRSHARHPRVRLPCRHSHVLRCLIRGHQCHKGVRCRLGRDGGAPPFKAGPYPSGRAATVLVGSSLALAISREGVLGREIDGAVVPASGTPTELCSIEAPRRMRARVDQPRRERAGSTASRKDDCPFARDWAPRIRCATDARSGR